MFSDRVSRHRPQHSVPTIQGLRFGEVLVQHGARVQAHLTAALSVLRKRYNDPGEIFALSQSDVEVAIELRNQSGQLAVRRSDSNVYRGENFLP